MPARIPNRIEITRFLILLIAIFFVHIRDVKPQIPAGSSAREIPTSLQQQVEDQVSKVISTAEDYFRRGKLNLEDDKRDQARIDFDKAVNSILESGLDVRTNQRLQGFYLELVERIYREEVPTSAFAIVGSPGGQIGFKRQEVKQSPLDELSKLVLDADKKEPTSVLVDSTSVRQVNRQPSRTTKQPSKVALGECMLTADQLPEVRGFRLGQRFAVLSEQFPNDYFPRFRERKDEVGLQETTVSPILVGSPESLKGVRTIELNYLDGMLVSIKVDYDSEVRWQSNLDFTAAIAEQLRLPLQGWQGRDPSRLVCNAFITETSDATFAPSLRIEKTNLQLEILRRRKELDRKKRIEFKP